MNQDECSLAFPKISGDLFPVFPAGGGEVQNIVLYLEGRPELPTQTTKLVLLDVTRPRNQYPHTHRVDERVPRGFLQIFHELAELLLTSSKRPELAPLRLFAGPAFGFGIDVPRVSVMRVL
jgi:hypothetical protein